MSRSILLLLINFSLLIQPLTAQTEKQVRWGEILRQPTSWYGSDEAQRIADNVLLYQHENGGWYKNIDMAQTLSEEEQKEILKAKTEPSGTTIDNGATFTQLRFLALVYDATKEKKYQSAFLRGIDYLLAAQYENGGWPQYYPIRKGYYEHITYNDGAMIGVMSLLRDVSEGNDPYDFVKVSIRKKTKAAVDKGLGIILDTQVVLDGELTIWCAQHDKDSLEPAKARAFELASLSGAESVNIVRYLMQLSDPDPRVIKAIEHAVTWFDTHKIENMEIKKVKDENLAKGYDLMVVDKPGAAPLWARFYDLKTQQPIYVGRDGVKRDQLKDIEYERRVGYSYLGNYAERLLERDYPIWKSKWME
ncbi:pectate lyase [Echinicola sp. CAU 1574]|uniref:Pectate lyase n=1 Tax=Echinicola arenosa TaxID=2774144 RepID=A0ABR9ALT8_9BACT|nr:pectate lyase [Echinicola arenosa]MBD8488584.1 pectate lyase [Echinicola arenosa]